MRKFSVLSVALVGFGIGAIANAQAATIGLTAEQKEAILADNSEAKVDSALSGNGPDRRIHGEVGAMIGTNGARGIFGTAAIPLGENGGALISFENSRYGHIR